MEKYFYIKQLSKGAFGSVAEFKINDCNDKYAIKLVKNFDGIRNDAIIEIMSYRLLQGCPYISNLKESIFLENNTYLVQPLWEKGLKDLSK